MTNHQNKQQGVTKMTIIAASIAHGEVAIASDTLFVSGSLCLPSEFLPTDVKIISCGKGKAKFGFAGVAASQTAFDAVLRNDLGDCYLEFLPEDIETAAQLFDFLCFVHQKLKEKYFLNPNDNGEYSKPFEVSQFTFIMINKHGIFSSDYFRNTTKHDKFFAIGSGREYAMGAMYGCYEHCSRQEPLGNAAISIATTGVVAASKFDDSCELPIKSYGMTLHKEKDEHKTS